jgi:hypothetical protein
VPLLNNKIVASRQRKCDVLAAISTDVLPVVFVVHAMELALRSSHVPGF